MFMENTDATQTQQLANKIAVADATIADLKTANERLLAQVRQLHAQTARRKLASLYQTAFGSDMPELDEDAAWERISDLMSNDDDEELWTPERTFEVEMHLNIRHVTTVRARSADEARELAQNDARELLIRVDGVEVDDVEVDDLVITEG
jgi:hypothetical protein